MADEKLRLEDLKEAIAPPEDYGPLDAACAAGWQACGDGTPIIPHFGGGQTLTPILNLPPARG